MTSKEDNVKKLEEISSSRYTSMEREANRLKVWKAERELYDR
jgi:hypothetical protein